MFNLKMETGISEIGDVQEIKTLSSLFKQMASSTTLPFYGEPLMGLQAMGMLETRTLDFDNVILLSANENVLPVGKATNSFIPFDIKKHFGLQTYGDKDAVFAYHLYRLLQRAKKIVIFYSTEKDEFGSGEMSRYVTQLLYELPRANKNIKIKQFLVSMDAGELKRQPVYIGGLGRVFTEIYDLESHRINRHLTRLKLTEALDLQVVSPKQIPDLKLSPGRIFVITSGMMVAHTAAHDLAVRMAGDPRHSILFVGYADPDSPAGKLRAARHGSRFHFSDEAPQLTKSCQVEEFDLSAHFEHTIAITDHGPEVLTLPW